MDNKFCWHRAAEISGRVDFSFTKFLPEEDWKDHLIKSIGMTQVNRLYSPLKEPGVQYIRFIDKQYPKLLSDNQYAPPVIYVEGNQDLLKGPFVSIVGSRKSTYLGRQFAKQVSLHAQKMGHVTVSGLAYGIDEAAHRGALASTIGVMAQGIKANRSASRERLSCDILKAGGVLISEFPPNWPAQKWTYLHRNRLIAWLCNCFILVEAPKKSGAMNTTQIALDSNKPLYVVPHHPLVESAVGGLELILEGAVPLIHPAQLPLDVIQDQT